MRELFSRAAMALLLAVFTSTASAKVGDVLASGTCGDNVTWTLTDNGEKYYRTHSLNNVRLYNCVTLTISGTGEITNRDYYESTTGLFGSGDSRSDQFISSVIIEEGVTSIPAQAFYRFQMLRHVSLPSTLTTIGYGAFVDCDVLKSIVIPDGVTQIQRLTFDGCDSLRSVSLGKGVKSIEQYAFRNCKSLMTLRLKRYEPDDQDPITTFRNGSSFYPFPGCVSLVSIVLPEAGKARYLEYEKDGEIYRTVWYASYFTDADGHSRIYFYDNLIRSDRDTLFRAGTTNEWTAWADKFNHAAPRGFEVYTVSGIEGRTLKLNKLTATVTLPEDEREGPGDDGVRPLVPAFTAVLIKRPSGTLTEDQKMQFVMGGELTPENGWYCSRSLNPSLWGESGNYGPDAISKYYAPTVMPDILAGVPYGYHTMSYNITVEGDSPAGRGDYLYGYFDEGYLWGNVDKTSIDEGRFHSLSTSESRRFKLENDQFRLISESEAEEGVAPHHCVLSLNSEDLGGDLDSPFALGINERTEVTLADGGTDNTDAIVAAASTTNNRVELSGRTLYTDGDWNTLCLPFDVNFHTYNSSKSDFLFSFPVNYFYDAIVMELDTEETYDGYQTGIDAEDGTLRLYFKQVYAIEAGKPYLVKWDFRCGSVSNPVFYNAVINSTAPTPVTFPGGEFVGTYECLPFTATDRNILFIGSENKLHFPKVGATIGAFRSYFHLDPSASVKACVLNFVDEQDEATSLSEELRVKREQSNVAIFNLAGQRLSKVQKGINIVGGRKVLK